MLHPKVVNESWNTLYIPFLCFYSLEETSLDRKKVAITLQVKLKCSLVVHPLILTLASEIGKDFEKKKYRIGGK